MNKKKILAGGMDMGRITPLSELPLSNDFMFGAVMSQEPIAKLFLEALLDISIEKIIYIGVQETPAGEYYARGVRLDVFLKDDKGTVYNIEMQMSNDKDIEYRIRYYQGKIDRETLRKGAAYDELPDSYIVFVCNFDYFKRGLAVYKRKSVIEGCEDVSYDDGSHVYVLNSRYSKKNAATPIIEFLDYVRRNDSSMEYQSELVKSVVSAVGDVRRDKEKEDIYMTYVQKMEDMKRKGIKEGIQLGIEGMASALKSMGQSKEFVQEALMRSYSLSLDEARQVLDRYW